MEPAELQAAAGRREKLPKAAVQMGTARAVSCVVDRVIPSPVAATLSLFDTGLPFFPHRARRESQQGVNVLLPVSSAWAQTPVSRLGWHLTSQGPCRSRCSLLLCLTMSWPTWWESA